MPPRSIAGYDIVRPLSAGAQGEVFLARDRTVARNVAVKLLHASAMADADAARRFERETRAAIAIRHRNVVAAIDSGTVDGRPFLVSEFVPGGSLEELLAREKRLAPERARRLAADLLRGLDAIHRAGLVHRDVKPANVLLSETGEAKLADLGLARRTAVERTQLTVDGAIVGTPAYVAPEQILRGDEIDGRADLYSLGVTLFECLAGERPFAADDVIALLRLHVSAAPPDVAARASVPPDLAALVRRLLAKRPEERPAGAAAALAAIDLEPAPALPSTLADAGAPPAAIRFRDENGSFLLVVACPEKGEIVLGRDAAGNDPRRICLRVLPHAANAEKSMRISGTHVALRRTKEGSWIACDRSSTHGTTLDGRRLAPGEAAEVRDGALLRLADVLDLRARLLPVAARGSEEAAPPSVLLERPSNGSHHRYLLVAAPVAIDRAARPVAAGAGTTILAAAEDGSLAWLAAGDARGATLEPGSPQPDDPKT